MPYCIKVLIHFLIWAKLYIVEYYGAIYVAEGDGFPYQMFLETVIVYELEVSKQDLFLFCLEIKIMDGSRSLLE